MPKLELCVVCNKVLKVSACHKMIHIQDQTDQFGLARTIIIHEVVMCERTTIQVLGQRVFHYNIMLQPQ